VGKGQEITAPEGWGQKLGEVQKEDIKREVKNSEQTGNQCTSRWTSSQLLRDVTPAVAGGGLCRIWARELLQLLSFGTDNSRLSERDRDRKRKRAEQKEDKIKGRERKELAERKRTKTKRTKK
jgi:hypothetical protein